MTREQSTSPVKEADPIMKRSQIRENPISLGGISNHGYLFSGHL